MRQADCLSTNQSPFPSFPLLEARGLRVPSARLPRLGPPSARAFGRPGGAEVRGRSDSQTRPVDCRTAGLRYQAAGVVDWGFIDRHILQSHVPCLGWKVDKTWKKETQHHATPLSVVKRNRVLMEGLFSTSMGVSAI